MLIVFNWSISRAYGYEGQNVCTMRVEGKKVAGCMGGNYDMQGTCLGLWMQNHFKEELKKFKFNKDGSSDFSGLKLAGGFKGLPYLSGGWDELTKILEELGYCLECGNSNYRFNEYFLNEI